METKYIVVAIDGNFYVRNQETHKLIVAKDKEDKQLVVHSRVIFDSYQKAELEINALKRDIAFMNPIFRIDELNFFEDWYELNQISL